MTVFFEFTESGFGVLEFSVFLADLLLFVGLNFVFDWWEGGTFLNMFCLL